MSSINWVGNRVVDPGVPRLRSEIPSVPTQKTDPNIITPELTRQADPNIITPELIRQGPPPSTEIGYIPYYLTQNIGKSVRAEFIIGTTQYVDKTGVLFEVGINYFVLDDVNSRTKVMCDLYSVKFVTILP